LHLLSILIATLRQYRHYS